MSGFSDLDRVIDNYEKVTDAIRGIVNFVGYQPSDGWSDDKASNDIKILKDLRLGLLDPKRFKSEHGESFKSWLGSNGEYFDSMVRISKYTPNLKNGKGVSFQIGDECRYQTRDGEKYSIVIASKLKENSGYLGYEALFDNGEYAFAVEDGIYDWEGKV